jgi:DNA-binding beta-propeller fold protein YncE
MCLLSVSASFLLFPALLLFCRFFTVFPPSTPSVNPHPQSVGTNGSELDQFNCPLGVALTPDQAYLVVVDRVNRRLVVRDATDGRSVSTLTPAPGVLPSPCGVVMVPHTGQLLVTDGDRHQVVLLGGLADATVVRVFGEGQGSGDLQLNNPMGVVLVSASDVALAADASVVAAAAAGQDPTLVAIADSWGHRVVLYRLSDAAFVRCFGSQGRAPGQFTQPQSIVSVLSLGDFQTIISFRMRTLILMMKLYRSEYVFFPRLIHAPGCSRPHASCMDGNQQIPSACIPAGGSGWLAVTDAGNRRVQVVTLTGQVVRVLEGDAANGLGQLRLWLGGITVCVDAQGNPELLVSDTSYHRVVAFRLDGRTARVVCGEPGRGAGELYYPTGLAVTATGNLWVVENYNHRVSLFQ